MFPASLAACVPVFIATPDVGLRQRRRIVGAVTGHRHQPTAALLLADQVHLVFGSGLGEEVVDAGFLRDDRSRTRVVTGDHHGADPHSPKVLEPLGDAGLDDVLEVDHAEGPRGQGGGPRGLGLGHHERCAALGRDGVDGVAELGRYRAALFLDPAAHGVGRALAHRPAFERRCRSSGSAR